MVQEMNHFGARKEEHFQLHDEADLVNFRADALNRYITNQDLLDNVALKLIHTSQLVPPRSFPHVQGAGAKIYLENATKDELLAVVQNMNPGDLFSGDLRLMRAKQEVLAREIAALEAENEAENVLSTEAQFQKQAVDALAAAYAGYGDSETALELEATLERTLSEYSSKFGQKYVCEERQPRKFSILIQNLAPEVVVKQAPADYDPRKFGNTRVLPIVVEKPLGTTDATVTTGANGTSGANGTNGTTVTGADGTDGTAGADGADDNIHNNHNTDTNDLDDIIGNNGPNVDGTTNVTTDTNATTGNNGAGGAAETTGTGGAPADGATDMHIDHGDQYLETAPEAGYDGFDMLSDGEGAAHDSMPFDPQLGHSQASDSAYTKHTEPEPSHAATPPPASVDMDDIDQFLADPDAGDGMDGMLMDFEHANDDEAVMQFNDAGAEEPAGMEDDPFNVDFLSLMGNGMD